MRSNLELYCNRTNEIVSTVSTEKYLYGCRMMNIEMHLITEGYNAELYDYFRFFPYTCSSGLNHDTILTILFFSVRVCMCMCVCAQNV